MGVVTKRTRLTENPKKTRPEMGKRLTINANIGYGTKGTEEKTKFIVRDRHGNAAERRRKNR